ncbi:hypothetical protein [Sphingorhabdus sp. Alg239-R122]|uniref:hypothetical protein n=1 Tax=Sphingorhabdus sp. Alg239-R122 TaxID=2305989 RepID=UPI0013DA9EB8|nr:hypothetical protein [Sphingorhabdus sp. Alg239-R122]
MKHSRKFRYAALTSLMLLAACQTADKADIAPSPVADGNDSGITRAGPWKDFYNDTRNPGIPHDIRVFITKTQACGHFSGEEPYDTERGAFLRKMIDENCTGLPDAHAALRRSYAGNTPLLTAISEVWEIMGEAETVP